MTDQQLQQSMIEIAERLEAERQKSLPSTQPIDTSLIGEMLSKKEARP